jgi:hypothetical protein
MTQKTLTIKDLNCGNCPGPCPVLFGTCFDDREDNSHTSITRVIGCASHPSALQVLAAPVIEELGKEEKEQIEIYQNATAKNEEVYHQGIVFVIQMAIKLLKEGVKKP